MIGYKKGVDNGAADALSRKSLSPACCLDISSCQPQWLTQLQQSYEGDPYTSEVIAKVTMDESVVPHFKWQQGVLRYKGRIWVGDLPDLHSKLLSAFHDSVLGGHSWVPVTYRLLKQYFAWKGMKTTTHTYVQSCIVCQQAKPDMSKSPRLLQPLPIPDESWQIVTMDFIDDLPQSGSANCIVVVVDKFTKFAHFLLIRHPYTAASVAKVFLDQVYKLHAMPQSIISDMDPIFTSNAYHP
jgi:hypothetical protein